MLINFLNTSQWLNTYICFGQVVVQQLKKNVIGDKIDPKAVLNLDSGLGVFDAFFASLSMILVSEVCVLFLCSCISLQLLINKENFVVQEEIHFFVFGHNFLKPKSLMLFSHTLTSIYPLLSRELNTQPNGD